MDIGLLIVRVVVGLLFIGHGSQKLFGWFGGGGVRGTAGFMRSLGFRPPVAAAVAGGTAELVGGVLLGAGFVTPFAAVLIIGMMVNAAATVHASNGVWAADNGFELHLTYAAAAAALAFVGPGSYSLDAAFGLDLSGWTWGVAAVAIGVGGAVLSLASRAITAPSAEAATEEEERKAA